MIDANINRVCEGLRIIEDILRFEINNTSKILPKIIEDLKKIRHFIRKNINIKTIKKK